MATIYATAFHLENAAALAEQANQARQSGKITDEIRTAMGAYLMAALSLEGAANEVAKSILTPWAWDRLEKAEPSLKWYLISRFGSSDPSII